VHVGLGPGVRLTRREWGAVRRALGRPRRLSLAFLRQERAKLETYRNIVRAKYEEVRPWRALFQQTMVLADVPASLLVPSLCQLLGRHSKHVSHDTPDVSCMPEVETNLLCRWAMAMRHRRRCPSRCTWGSV
jgi:DIRP